jgi:hypothetical protein
MRLRVEDHFQKLPSEAACRLWSPSPNTNPHDGLGIRIVGCCCRERAERCASLYEWSAWWYGLIQDARADVRASSIIVEQTISCWSRWKLFVWQGVILAFSAGEPAQHIPSPIMEEVKEG